MPWSAPRPCKVSGCSGLARRGTVYCSNHARLASPGPRVRGPRPYSKATWKRIRARVLAEYPVCQWLGCDMPASECDHIVALAAGGTDDRANLQALCKRHHSIKTNREDGGFGRPRRTVSNGLGNMDRDRYTGRETVGWAQLPECARPAYFHEF